MVLSESVWIVITIYWWFELLGVFDDKGSKPVLPPDQDLELMRELIKEGWVRPKELKFLGVRQLTIDRHYRAEMKKYPKIHWARGHGQEIVYKPLFTQDFDTTESEETLECRESVLKYYLNRQG